MLYAGHRQTRPWGAGPTLLLSSNPSLWDAIADHYSATITKYAAFSGTLPQLVSYSGFSDRTKALYAMAVAGGGWCQAVYTALGDGIVYPDFDSGTGIDVYMDWLGIRNGGSSATYGYMGFNYGSSDLQIACMGGSHDNLSTITATVGDSRSLSYTIGAGGQKLTSRIQIAADIVRVKSWTAGDDEPDTWDAELSLSSAPLGAGIAILPFVRAGADNGGTSGEAYFAGWAVWATKGSLDTKLPWPLNFDFGT